MKSFFSVFALSLLVSTTSFAKATMICKNEGFSNLTVQLDSLNGLLTLTVLEPANAKDTKHSPQSGEKAVLDLFPEAMQSEWLVYHSTESSSGRAYEISIPEEAAGQKDFKISLRSSPLEDDSVFYSYGMYCVRQ